MKVAALGRTKWLYDSILAVAERGHEIVLIGTCSAAPEYTVTEEDFARLAAKLNSVYFCDPAINRPNYIELVRNSGAEVAISVNWLTIIGQEMLDQFKYGVINAHAGDLPRFRGNAVPNWAILTGETKVVLTLHQMTVDLDAGPILLQRVFPLTPNSYIADVYHFIEQNVPIMFTEVVDRLAANEIIAREQPSDPALSLRCFPRLPQDSQIDWTQPAVQIARLIRAVGEPFNGAYTYLGENRLIIWRAHTEEAPTPYLAVPGQVAELRRSGEVAVCTVEGWLVLEEVELEGMKRVKPRELIKSSRTRLGLNPADEIASLNRRILALEHQLAKLEHQLTKKEG